MVKCSFCSSEIPQGTGKMYVKKDGTLFYFCSRKCDKNLLKLGRSRTKTKWTGRYHAIKEIRMRHKEDGSSGKGKKEE